MLIINRYKYDVIESYTLYIYTHTDTCIYIKSLVIFLVNFLWIILFVIL